MMARTGLLLALMAPLSTAAYAQQGQSTSANVPTGYQVKGCTSYTLQDGKRVSCFTVDKSNPSNPRATRPTDTRDPFGGSSEGGGGGGGGGGGR